MQCCGRVTVGGGFNLCWELAHSLLGYYFAYSLQFSWWFTHRGVVQQQKVYAEVDADADSLRDKSSVGYFYFLPTNNNFRSHHLSFGILPLSNNTIMQLVLVAIVNNNNNNNNNNNIRVEWKHEIEGTNCGPGTALAALGSCSQSHFTLRSNNSITN